MTFPQDYRKPVAPYSKMWKGIVGEKLASEILKQHGIDNQLMPHRHPFDIFTSGRERIDVKSVWRKTGGGYSVYLDKQGKEIDAYIIVGLADSEPVFFVLPATCVPDVCGISIRWPKRGKWTWTHNRFDLLQPAASGESEKA